MTAHPIREELRKRGSSLRWFAGRVGLEESRVCHILAGRRKAPPTFYREAALILGVDVAELQPEPDGQGVPA